MKQDDLFGWKPKAQYVFTFWTHDGEYKRRWYYRNNYSEALFDAKAYCDERNFTLDYVKIDEDR